MMRSDMEPVKVYRREKEKYGWCEIRLYESERGYSFGVTVLLKKQGQGFSTPCMEKVGMIYSTEIQAFVAAEAFILKVIKEDTNYTNEQKKVMRKLLYGIYQEQEKE
jgi:hypothetical protein